MALLGEIMVMFTAETAGFTTGAGAVVAALVGVGAAIGESIHMAGDFQQGLTRLSTTAGESAGNLGMIGDGLLKISTQTATSASDLVAAMYTIESGGYHGAQGLAVMTIAAQAARMEQANLTDVSKALVTVMTDYHMPASQAANAMNELVTAVSLGRANLQDMSRAMASVLPIASASGVSFAEVGAAIAVMTNKGNTAQVATKWLANAITALTAPNAVAVKSMKEVGLTAQDLSDTLRYKGLGPAIQEVSDAIGKKFPAGSVEAVEAFKKIMGGVTGYKVALELGGASMKTYMDDVNKVAASARQGGSAIQNWGDVQANFNFKLDQAKMAAQAFMITLGAELLPVVGDLLGKITPMITGFIDWESKTHGVENAVKSLVGGILNIISGITGFVDLLNRNATAMDLFKSVLTAFAVVVAPLVVLALASMAVAAWAAMAPMLPFIALIGVIALAIFGLITLIRNWGAIMDWLTGKTKQATLEQGEQQEKARIKAIDESLKQKDGVLKNMEDERTQLIAKIKGMANDADKSRAQIQLSALNAQIATTKGNIKELDNEKAQHLQKLKELQAQDPQIREQTKLAAVKVQVEQKNALLKTLDDEKAQLIKKITDEKDGSTKERDLMKLDAINKQTATTVGTLNALNNEYTQHMGKLDKLKADDLEGRKNWYERANDATTTWVNTQTKDLDGMIKSWGVGLQTWGDTTLSTMNTTIQGWSVGLQTWGDTTLNDLNTTIQGWGMGLQTWGDNVLSFIGTMAGDFASGLGGIANSAFQWGANIVQNIASGIQNSIGAVIQAAQNVASAIANFLPHSPAKEGPLRKLNEFGPALVHGITSGIDRSTPMFKSSMEHLLTPTGGTGQGSIVGGSNGNGTQTIIIQMDGRDMAKALGPHLTNEIRLVAQVRR